MVSKWFFSQTASIVYALALSELGRYCFEKWNVFYMNPFYWYIFNVGLFFLFAFIFKKLLNHQNNNTEFTFSAIRNMNYIQSIYNFKNINHINHTQGVIPAFEGLETMNTLIVIFEQNITKKYEIIITSLDNGYLFNPNCDKKSYNYCLINIKGSEICKGNGRYKIEIKPVD